MVTRASQPSVLSGSSIDPKDSLVIVSCYPDGLCDPSIPAWLANRGFDLGPAGFVRGCVRDVTCALNQAVRVFLASPKTWLLYVERDLQVGPICDPLLSAAEDLACVQYDVGIPGAWSHPLAFHTGMWRARRGVLEAIAPPWFLPEYSPDGTEVATCCCGHFARKATAAGFSIARAGQAGHRPKGTSHASPRWLAVVGA